jgi:hypothetical protein
VPGTVAHVLRDAEEQRKAALAHAQRCVVQLGIFDRTSRKLLDMGSGSLLEGGHILSAAHVFDRLTDPAHVVLVATFAGHLQRPQWSFAAELLTPPSLLERGAAPGVRIDLAVARITGSITCDPPCFQGLQSLADCTYALADGFPVASAGYDAFVQGLPCAAGGGGQLPHLACDRTFYAAFPLSRVTIVGYPVAVGNHLHSDSADVVTVEDDMLRTQAYSTAPMLRTQAYIQSASSGGPAISGAGSIVGVVSYDAGNPRLSFLRSVHLLTPGHGWAEQVIVPVAAEGADGGGGGAAAAAPGLVPIGGSSS